MGCISSKEFRSSPKERSSHKALKRRVAHVNSSRREESVRSKNKSDNLNVKVKLIGKTTDIFDEDDVERKHREELIEQNKVYNCEDASISLPNIERKKGKYDIPVHWHPGSGRVSKSCEAERIAAGWPSWLASVAGEAIEGWVPQRANTFEKLDRIGQGTYSNVYKARNVTNNKFVALKKVRFDNTDLESVKFMIREILILRRLQHPNVIKLEGLITSQTSSSLYLIFEYMEHDLTGLASLPGIKFSEPQIKCYMQQLLTGLDYCHSQGVLHRDIKGSNLLIDDNGVLKIADFGLASFFDPQGTAQLTSRVVTLWYRAPELLLGATCYDVAVDLWSAGCILGELYAGKPILPGRTEVEQLHRIFKLCGSPSEDYWRKSKLPRSSVIKPQRPYRRCIAEMFKALPASAVGLMETLLSMDPTQRGTAASALKCEFFTTKPFACDPSSLPKYPPSKEIDAKLRDEEARRQGVHRSRETGQNVSVDGLVPNINPKLTASQKGRNSSSSSRSVIFNMHKEQAVSGFLADPSKKYQPVKGGRDPLERQYKKVSHSGPLVNGTNWTKTGKDVDGTHALHPRANLSAISGLVAARTSQPEDCQEKPGPSQPVMVKQGTRAQRLSHGPDNAINQDQNFQTQKTTDCAHAEAGNSSSREQNAYGRATRGNKIYVSGPLLPSNNMEQMLKEHDRRIQDFTRRRLDKSKVGELAAGNLIYVSRR